MNPSYPWLVVAIAAGVTLFTRALPFAVFGGRRGMPAPVKYLGGVLPAGIIAILVVYCLKGPPQAAPSACSSLRPWRWWPRCTCGGTTPCSASSAARRCTCC